MLGRGKARKFKLPAHNKTSPCLNAAWKEEKVPKCLMLSWELLSQSKGRKATHTTTTLSVYHTTNVSLKDVAQRMVKVGRLFQSNPSQLQAKVGMEGPYRFQQTVCTTSPSKPTCTMGQPCFMGEIAGSLLYAAVSRRGVYRHVNTGEHVCPEPVLSTRLSASTNVPSVLSNCCHATPPMPCHAASSRQGRAAGYIQHGGEGVLKGRVVLFPANHLSRPCLTTSPLSHGGVQK